MKKHLILQLFVLGFILFLPTDAIACSCLEYEKPTAKVIKQAKKVTDAIFTGKVLNITENQEADNISVKLRVISVWKGQIKKTVTVLSGLHGGNCRYYFEVGSTYLVYADNSTMYSPVISLSTGSCDRTSMLSAAKTDIRFLGKSRKPRKSWSVK